MQRQTAVGSVCITQSRIQTLDFGLFMSALFRLDRLRRCNSCLNHKRAGNPGHIVIYLRPVHQNLGCRRLFIRN